MRIRRSAVAATALVAAAAVSLAAPAIADGRGNDQGSNEQSQNGQSERPSRGDGNGGHGQNSEDAYTIGLWGDQPYDDKNPGYRATIIDSLVKGSINTQKLEFTIFDGDIKGGGETCDNAKYDFALKMFNEVSWPTVYTPGDNEWTDCDRTSNGPNPDTGLNYVPNERLAKIRSMFFSSPRSLGATTMELTQQSSQFPENARWEHDGVTYLTLDVPGSDNNYPTGKDADGGNPLVTGKPADGDSAEYMARNAANLAWLEQGFRLAREEKSKGLMIVIQADMWNLNGNADNTAHYAETKDKLASLVAANPKLQVVLVNGDTHVFKQDNPLNITDPAKAYANFTRVTTAGSNKAHGWTKVDVTPKAANVFTFTQITTP